MERQQQASSAPQARNRAAAGERLAVAGRRAEVLEAVRDQGDGVGVTELAQRLGMHPNTVRFHLDDLEDRGFVSRATPTVRGPGRPPLVFTAVRSMDRTGRTDYRTLAGVLADALAREGRAAIAARSAGQIWARSVATEPRPGGEPFSGDPVKRVLEVMMDHGFEPEARTVEGEEQIALRHCPFLDLAGTHPQVICPLHQGLIEGTLELAGSSVAVGQLEAFAEPDICLVHLRR